MSRRRSWIVLAIVSAAAVAAVYGGTLGDGLLWDDYSKLRPTGWADILGALHGSWDPLGIWPAYFRPLAVGYDALAFHVFGLNAVAHHVVSMVELTLVAWLVSVFVLRETGSVWIAAFAAVTAAVHPFAALTEAPWFNFQYQTLAVVTTLCALLLWQARRMTPTIGRWWPILATIAAGFLIKEDTLLVAGAVVAAQAVRARIVTDVPPPRGSVVAATALFMAVLIGVRHILLGQLGGEGIPDWPTAALNLLRGPVRVMFRFRGMFFDQTPALVGASVLSGLLFATGSLALWRTTGRARGLWLAGVLLGCFVDLPLGLVSTNTRYHLLVLAATLSQTAALSGLIQVSRRRWRMAVVALAAVMLALMLSGSRAELAEFAPCTTNNLFTDTEVLGMTPMPDAERNWLAQKPRSCARGTYAPLVEAAEPLVWGDGGPRVAILVNRHARALAVALRDVTASPASPAHIDIVVNSRSIQTIDLPSPAWRAIRVPLDGNAWTTLRQMHRVDVTDTSAGHVASIETQLLAAR